jgi:ribose transport system substrate-binding protein
MAMRARLRTEPLRRSTGAAPGGSTTSSPRRARLGWHRRFSIAALSVCLGLAGCASTSAGDSNTAGPGGTESGSGARPDGTIGDDIADYCPAEETTVAFAKGAGDSWTKVALATLEDEAAKCPSISDVAFTDAGGDQTKGIADINGLVAQGTDVIISMPEFGPAQVPALRSALQAGSVVVTQIDDAGAKIGQDISGAVLVDTAAVGEAWAAWLHATVGTGKVVFLGGIPGAASSKQLFDGLTSALAAYPELELVEDHVVDTNWDAGTRQRVMAGLLAKYGRIDGVVTDYGAIDYGTLNAYAQAGMELPALAAFASSNGLACYWAKTPFDVMSVDGQVNLIRKALRVGLAALQGDAPSSPVLVDLTTSFDTNAGVDPTCDANLPDDAPVGSDLSEDQLVDVFQ